MRLENRWQATPTKRQRTKTVTMRMKKGRPDDFSTVSQSFFNSQKTAELFTCCTLSPLSVFAYLFFQEKAKSAAMQTAIQTPRTEDTFRVNKVQHVDLCPSFWPGQLMWVWFFVSSSLFSACSGLFPQSNSVLLSSLLDNFFVAEMLSLLLVRCSLVVLNFPWPTLPSN